MLGLCYLRVPTWCPFRLQFYCNGHGWLARKLAAAGIAFTAEAKGLRRNYWWGAAYDAFDGRAWDRDDAQTHDVGAGVPLTDVPGGDLGVAAQLIQMEATITPRRSAFARGMVLAIREDQSFTWEDATQDAFNRLASAVQAYDSEEKG